MLIDTKNPRITIGYKEGKGDKGFSVIKTCTQTCTSNKISKEIGGVQSISKGSNQLKVYMELDNLRNRIGEILNPSLMDRLLGNTIKDTSLLNLLEWLLNDSFSLGAQMLLEGNSERHKFTEDILFVLDNYIQTNKAKVGDCADFIIHKGYLAKLDSIRVSIRTLELLFHEGKESSPPHPQLDLCLSIINRLSSALFWAIRCEYKLRHLPEIYWSGSRTSLSL